MALPDIQIDDRTFDQLFAVLRKQMPADYTDHNPSDPVITLLELFCWLGEMELYRMNRVPPEHEQKFLDLLIDRPVPVTVPVTFTVDFAAPPAAAVAIAAGTRVATDFHGGRRFVFETLEDAVPEPPSLTQTVTVTARELLAVHDELLGVSDGSPHQAFRLSPVRGDLGLAPDDPAPLLVDFVHRSAGYQPNPQVRLDTGSELWEARHSLLTEKSRVDLASPAEPRHFSVEAATRVLRFGDGVFGAIPPAGSQIICERYQLLQGPAALIEAGEIQHLLTPIPGLAAGDTVTVSNEDDASGGVHFFTAGQRLAAGLESFRKPHRLVTAADFERVLLDDFNDFQELAGRPERVARAVAAMNRKPDDDVEAPGHVTVIVLRRLTAADQATLDDPYAPLAAKEALLALGAADPLERRLLSFLDRRRLITTRVHVAAPRLTGVGIDLRLVIDNHRNAAEMERIVDDAVRQFLDVLAGGFDQRGWPPGRDVYRSEILRLVEGLDGVDHVDSLELTPAAAGGDVEVGPHRLPVIEKPPTNVTALRP
ncbi:MAG: hypothetical protein GY856_55745 [bacterium]|nr:hypothetical protein [bacterium]